MSPLPADFQFNQNNLQNYTDCARRFELRHLLRLEWPALQSEPVLEMEHRAALGQQFHDMVYQSILGVPLDQIAAQTNDPDLLTWWDDFTQSTVLQNIPAKRKPEFTLSAPFGNYRLTAKYDLLAIDPGSRAVIVDWKTSSKPLAATYLSNRLQTRVYPFLLAEAGHFMNNGSAISPEQIETIYWFTASPEKPVHFHYSAKQLKIDREFLTAMVSEIAARPSGSFQLTLDEKKCTYCIYRSLCDRGTRAGNMEDTAEELVVDEPLNISFDQIGEIEF